MVRVKINMKGYKIMIEIEELKQKITEHVEEHSRLGFALLEFKEPYNSNIFNIPEVLTIEGFKPVLEYTSFLGKNSFNVKFKNEDLTLSILFTKLSEDNIFTDFQFKNLKEYSSVKERDRLHITYLDSLLKVEVDSKNYLLEKHKNHPKIKKEVFVSRSFQDIPENLSDKEEFSVEEVIDLQMDATKKTIKVFKQNFIEKYGEDKLFNEDLEKLKSLYQENEEELLDWAKKLFKQMSENNEAYDKLTTDHYDELYRLKAQLQVEREKALSEFISNKIEYYQGSIEEFICERFGYKNEKEMVTKLRGKKYVILDTLYIYSSEQSPDRVELISLDREEFYFRVQKRKVTIYQKLFGKEEKVSRKFFEERLKKMVTINGKQPNLRKETSFLDTQSSLAYLESFC